MKQIRDMLLTLKVNAYKKRMLFQREMNIIEMGMIDAAIDNRILAALTAIISDKLEFRDRAIKILIGAARDYDKLTDRGKFELSEAVSWLARKCQLESIFIEACLKAISGENRFSKINSVSALFNQAVFGNNEARQALKSLVNHEDEYVRETARVGLKQ
jgi:hypothetical protein